MENGLVKDNFFHNALFASYMQSNGFKPAPLDLNHVKLTPNQNTLVERLAENGHNVWARDRVRQGWTYSIVQVTPFPLCGSRHDGSNEDLAVFLNTLCIS